MSMLTFEDGVVRLGGVALPGILRAQRVACAVRFDEQKVDGVSGKRKTPLGWEDAEITLTLDLLTDDDATCYDRLETINGAFRGTDSRTNPKVLEVANRHLLARGIRRVVFSRLESEETDADDTLRATLAFVEHVPPIVRVEQAGAKTPRAADAAAQGSSAAPQQEASLLVDVSGRKARGSR
ncbi:MAG TPA: hypothetical protein VE028_01120 [Nitratidesulfovibrio sp.]|nr:hypothetical protein [Nitratidesulfovibrio sp.]